MPMPEGLAKDFDQETMELTAKLSESADEPDQLSLLAMEPILGEIKRGDRVMTAGRPKGSRNKRSIELARYILSRHRNPIEAAAEIVDAPIADLAASLKCPLIEAAEFWRKCAEFVASYVAQKMPQQVNVASPLAGYLTVINLSAERSSEPKSLSPHGLDMGLKPNEKPPHD